jgi:hypothetical protein
MDRVKLALTAVETDLDHLAVLLTDDPNAIDLSPEEWVLIDARIERLRDFLWMLKSADA